MRIEAAIQTTVLPKPYAQVSVYVSSGMLNFDTHESRCSFYDATPDELEAAAQALLDLAHALRTELAAYEERKGQEPKPEEVQP